MFQRPCRVQNLLVQKKHQPGPHRLSNGAPRVRLRKSVPFQEQKICCEAVTGEFVSRNRADMNLGTICADKSLPGDCAVRINANAASIIQLGGVVRFGLVLFAKWMSGTGQTFARWDFIIPAWPITHSESAKALIQATCPPICRMMTRLGTRPHRHALT